MPLQFTKEEVEEGLAGTLGGVTRKEIAKQTGLSESYIKRQFNSNDELHTAAFQILLIGCAIADLDEAAGKRFWQKFDSFREMSQMRSANKRTLNLEIEAGQLGVEIAEFISAKLTGKSYSEQFKELIDAEEKLSAVKKALIDEYNELKEKSPNVPVLKFANHGIR